MDLFYQDRLSAPGQPFLFGAALPWDFGEVFTPGAYFHCSLHRVHELSCALWLPAVVQHLCRLLPLLLILLVLVRPPPCPQHAWPLPAGTSMTETLSREPSESGGGMWDRSGFGSGGEVRQGKGGVALGGCY